MSDIKMKKEPRHAGVLFKRCFIDGYASLNMSNTAKALGVSRQHLTKFCNGEVSVTGEMAARLSLATDTNISFWLNLQSNYDAWHAERKIADLDVKVII